MPAARAIRLHGPGRGWISRPGRHGLEWLAETLPDETKAALRTRAAPAAGMTKQDARLEIVQAFECWRPAGSKLLPATVEFAALHAAGGLVSAECRALIPAFSGRTLRRWRESLRKHGTAALADRHVSGKQAIDPEMLDVIEGQMYARYPHVTARQIQRILSVEMPDRDPPSLRSIQRWMSRWVEQHRHALSAVTDPDRHRSHRMPAFGQADAGTDGLNALWELDSTRIDVICADGRRHSLVAGIDVWSRRARAVVAPQSNAEAICALVRRCILAWGVPRQVATDEGADYTSRHLRRAFVDLGIGQVVLPPYSPHLKPFVERFIGTISRDLFATLPGFSGHSVAHREAIRSRQGFAARRGQGTAEAFRCSLTPEELQARIDAWCGDLYEREPHAGLDGETPFARAAGWRGVRRTVDPRALDILLAAPAGGDGMRTVTKKGLMVDGGLYIAAALGPLVGTQVHVRVDPTDYGRVHVFGEGYICTAEDPLRTGIDRQAVAAEATALAREADREARAHARKIVAATKSATAIDRVLEAAAGQAGRVVPFPSRTEEQSGPMIDAAAEAADALETGVPAGDGGQARVIDPYINYYLNREKT